MTDNPLGRWVDETIFDHGRQLRWSYLPPLMVYLAAGVSGLTAIVRAGGDPGIGYQFCLAHGIYIDQSGVD